MTDAESKRPGLAATIWDRYLPRDIETPITSENNRSLKAMQNWLSYVESTKALVQLTYDGLDLLQRMPTVISVLNKNSATPPYSVEKAEERAVQATAEVASGFAILHAHSLLGLWGALECYVDDILRFGIEYFPELLSGDAFIKVKVSVSVIVDPDVNPIDVIALELGRQTKADLNQGIGRFECVLKPVNLDGAVPKVVVDAVYEAQQIRNVWAHRGGVADARFVEKCSQLKPVIGERFDLSVADYERLSNGLEAYGLIIINRILKALDRSDRIIKDPKGYEGVLESLFQEPYS